MGQRTTGQRMPAQKHNPFRNDSDRRVVASVVWWKEVMARIVAPRRRDGRSALFEVPEGSQPTLAQGGVAPAFAGIEGLTLAVESALPELEFEDVRGVVGEPLPDGEEPADGWSVRRFGGDSVGVDIGEF